MDPKTIDVTPEQQTQTQAVTVRDAVQALERMPSEKPAVTAAQAKVDAVANLTMRAYERAGMLELKAEEIQALQAPFDDDAFKPGAAGKEHLIYIEHAFLRDRLNTVIGPGQWALIPRSRWAEDFVSQKGVNGSRIYVEAMLVVRGAFVAEAVGEMEYYPKNASQNYGDAVEGAKTAALRRCCKEFGIGLQAWKKDWCEGWWQRRLAARKNAPPPVTNPALTRTASPAQQQTKEPEPTVFPVVNVASIKEVHSKPGAPKPWTAFFITFNDGFSDLEAATFDKKIAELANSLANTNEAAKLVVKPGKKPNTREIVSLERAEQPPPAPAEDNVPMEFDEHGQPTETMP